MCEEDAGVEWYAQQGDARQRSGQPLPPRTKMATESRESVEEYRCVACTHTESELKNLFEHLGEAHRIVISNPHAVPCFQE